MSVWLLLPVKGLAAGKSRLCGCLDDSTRIALNEALLRRAVSNACAFPGGAHTLVISACERALRIAADLGARTRVQRSTSGLNGAVREGVAALRCLAARRIVVLMADLPLVRCRDVEMFVSGVADERCIAMCPDKNGTGTNALMLPADARMSLRFGGASLDYHWREALRSGFVPRLHRDPRIALDIDTPRDLLRWLRAADAVTVTNDTFGDRDSGGVTHDVEAIATLMTSHERASLLATL